MAVYCRDILGSFRFYYVTIFYEILNFISIGLDFVYWLYLGFITSISIPH